MPEQLTPNAEQHATDERITPANPASQPARSLTSLGAGKPRLTPVRIALVAALIAFILGYAWWLVHDSERTQDQDTQAAVPAALSATSNQKTAASFQPTDVVAQLLSAAGVIAHDAYLMGTPAAAHAQMEADKASRESENEATSEAPQEQADDQTLPEQEIDQESQVAYDEILGSDSYLYQGDQATAPNTPDGSGAQYAPYQDSGEATQPQPAPAASSITVQVVVSSSTVGNVVTAQTSATLPAHATALDALLASGMPVVTRETQYGTYVVGIGGVSEKQYGGASGWLYAVNGTTPGYSAGAYELSDGDVVEWFYTV